VRPITTRNTPATTVSVCTRAGNTWNVGDHFLVNTSNSSCGGFCVCTNRGSFKCYYFPCKDVASRTCIDARGRNYTHFEGQRFQTGCKTCDCTAKPSKTIGKTNGKSNGKATGKANGKGAGKATGKGTGKATGKEKAKKGRGPTGRKIVLSTEQEKQYQLAKQLRKEQKLQKSQQQQQKLLQQGGRKHVGGKNQQQQQQKQKGGKNKNKIQQQQQQQQFEQQEWNQQIQRLKQAFTPDAITKSGGNSPFPITGILFLVILIQFFIVFLG